MLFAIVGFIMKVAPIGAFGAMAFTIGKYGLASLVPLAKLMGTRYATCWIFIFVVLGSIAKVHGFSIWKFIKYIKEEWLIVLGTSASESVLPRMMSKLENLGARKSTVRLVVPTGYPFNLDGTAIYLITVAVGRWTNDVDMLRLQCQLSTNTNTNTAADAPEAVLDRSNPQMSVPR